MSLDQDVFNPSTLVAPLNKTLLSKINGFTNKQPLICESYARKEIRKSIVAKRTIKKGETIKESDVYSVAGIVSRDLTFKLFNSINKFDASDSLKVLNEILEGNFSLHQNLP